MFLAAGVGGNELVSAFDDLLKAEARQVLVALKDYPDKQSKQTLNRTAEHRKMDLPEAHRRDWFVQVFDEDGNVLWQTDNAPTDEELRKADPHLEKWAKTDIGPYRLIYFKPDQTSDQKYYGFRLGSTKEPLNEELGKVNLFMVLAMLVICLVTPLGAYIMAFRAVQPVAKIIATTARLEPRNLTERLPIQGTGDEIDQLSLTINGMLDRIASFIERHREFIADAAHELRSPLTAIRSSVEVALNRPRPLEEYQTLLADVMEECTSLADLVNRLLLLAKGDGPHAGPGQDLLARQAGARIARHVSTRRRGTRRRARARRVSTKAGARRRTPSAPDRAQSHRQCRQIHGTRRQRDRIRPGRGVPGSRRF